MNHNSDTHNLGNELPGMKLGALIDSKIDERAIQEIQLISSAVTIYSASADYPKRDGEIKNLANQLLTGQIDMIVFLTCAGLNHFVERCAECCKAARAEHVE